MARNNVWSSCISTSPRWQLIFTLNEDGGGGEGYSNDNMNERKDGDVYRHCNIRSTPKGLPRLAIPLRRPCNGNGGGGSTAFFFARVAVVVSTSAAAAAVTSPPSSPPTLSSR